MTPSGHKAFLVQNPRDVELLLMHNNTYAAEFVKEIIWGLGIRANRLPGLVMLFHRERESKSLPRLSNSALRSRTQRLNSRANHEVDEEMVFSVWHSLAIVEDVKVDHTKAYSKLDCKLAYEKFSETEVQN